VLLIKDAFEQQVLMTLQQLSELSKTLKASLL